MADSYEINLEIQGGEQPALVMETEGGATDGASARNAEAWANGTRNGVPVEEGDPAYHNNSKYYRDSAAAIVAGDIIDDDAGIGDYNLTWSADKLAKKDESKAPVINVSDQTSAAVKTISDGADGMPMGLTVGIEPVQAGSGDPSPSNVRAISGWDAVKISRTGKNLFDLNTVTDGYAIGETGSISSNSSFSYSALIPVKTGGKYFMSFISATASSTHTRIHGYNASGTWVQQIMDKVTTSDSLITDSFTIPSGVSQIRISYRTANTEVTISALDEYEISIPSTPGTVYGGSLTVNKDGTGKLVVDSSLVTLPTFSSVKTASSGITYGTYNPTPLSLRDDNAICVISEVAKPYSFNGRPANEPFCVTRGNSGSTNDQIIFRADIGTTLEQFNALYAGTNIVYKLATPTEYNLTASEVNAIITSLKGVNNIFCDAGDILSVDYSADTKLYVDGKISEGMKLMALLLTANHEDGMKASKAYASGDLLTVGNTLYKATTSIANGAALTEGTNVTETTIAQELAALA